MPLTHDIVKRHSLQELLARKAEIITAAAKGVADLAASNLVEFHACRPAEIRF